MKQTDIAVYMQDEWKVRPNFTLSPGLRYENQNNIDSNFNFAPRIAFAWSPVFGHKKTSNPRNAQNRDNRLRRNHNCNCCLLLRRAPAAAPLLPVHPRPSFAAASDIFYNRISEDITLQATRFDGTNQQQFLVTSPAVLDLFPVVPPIEALDAFAQPQIRRVISDDLRTWRSLRFMFTAERCTPCECKTLAHVHARTH